MPRGSRCHESAQELIGKHVTVLPDSFLGASDDQTILCFLSELTRTCKLQHMTEHTHELLIPLTRFRRVN